MPTKTFEIQTRVARVIVGQDEQHQKYDNKFWLRFSGTETCTHEMHERMEKFMRNWKIRIKLHCAKFVSVYINTYVLPLIPRIHYAFLLGCEAKRIDLKNV
jgi:hypothetical protein